MNGPRSATTRVRPAGSAFTGLDSRQNHVREAGTTARYRSLTRARSSTGLPVAAATASLISSLFAQASGIALPVG